MKFLIIIAVMFFYGVLHSQPTLKVEVSADTVKPGQLVEITYTIENGEGQFEAPDFSLLPVVGGPNTSSSFMIQNGKKSSSQSYTYILRPEKEGVLIIPEAYFREKGHELKIDTVQIIVHDQSTTSAGQKQADKPVKTTREKKKF